MKFKSTLDEIVEETKCPTCGPSFSPFIFTPQTYVCSIVHTGSPGLRICSRRRTPPAYPDRPSASWETFRFNRENSPQQIKHGGAVSDTLVQPPHWSAETWELERNWGVWRWGRDFMYF